ncbi:MAG TPA: hypothetical protein VFY39_11565, partial [Gammaproteobacteria bacterium]|nr:hypothetical protein [Gammaproteobacteria bacterium]
MFARKLVTRGAGFTAALLILGLSSQVAAAADGQTAVYDAEAAAAAQAEFQAKLDEYLRSLNDRIELKLDRQLQKLQQL